MQEMGIELAEAEAAGMLEWCIVTSRLSGVAADLAGQLETGEPAWLRQAAAGAVRLAVERTELVSPVLDAALVALQEGRFGGSPERSAVLRLADELDGIAWDLQQRSEAGHVPQEAYLAAFGRARAAAAAGFALDGDALTAALEAVYEAQAAVADLGVIRAAVGSAMRD
jgi:hypothetical protein